MALRSLGPDITKQLFSDNWPIRRRWLRVAVIALWINAEVLLGYVLWTGGNALAVQLFLAVLGAIMTLICAYIFGAVWDDNNKRSNWRESRREDQEDEDGVLPTPPAEKE